MVFASKCHCPSCFKEIYLGECDIFSQKENRVLKKPRGPIARYKVEPLDGPEYTQQLACRRCYKCYYHLPKNIESVPSLTVAIIGDTFSGKTLYIAALIQQLQNEWVGNAPGLARFTCLTKEVEKKYKQNFFDPFLNQGQSLDPSLPATGDKADPLIYKLVTSASSKHPATAINLMIYDTAGEDFYQERLTEYARFVLKADAFIFVADPFTMKPITDQLQLPPSLQATWQPKIDFGNKSRVVELLNDVIDLVQQYHREPDGSSLAGIPIAIMLSKSDLLEHVQLPAPQRLHLPYNHCSNLPAPNTFAFLQNPSYGDILNLCDIKRVDEEVRAVLTHYMQRSLLASTRRFQQVSFFATSATGTLPDANGIFPSVTPRRCLDPFLWTLCCLGVLEGKKR